ILAGQRYSVVLNVTQPVNNYWIRAFASTISSILIRTPCYRSHSSIQFIFTV
ncbi:hypothetical protein DFH29DRAFT_811099, partial [Suillus ampliporus]